MALGLEYKATHMLGKARPINCTQQAMSMLGKTRPMNCTQQAMRMLGKAPPMNCTQPSVRCHLYDLKVLQTRSFLLKSMRCSCALCNLFRHSRVLVGDWVLLLATSAPFKLLPPLTVLHCATQHIETIHALLMLC